MDAFYASVESRDKPELAGKPLVVGGSPEGRGVVASCSYEARKFGIRSAMSSAKAKRLCPHVIFVAPDIKKYIEVSERIHEIFTEITPHVEPLSLDEAYLDVTENSLGEPLAGKVAIHIKRLIRSRTGLSSSAGVAPNKFLAKIASDLQKPDGLVIIPPDRVQAFIEKLPVEKLWGVGPVTAKKLESFGILTAKDIRRFSLSEMERLMGSFGAFLFELAHGRDDRPVESHWEPKSRGSETTFERDVFSLERLEEVLKGQAAELGEDLAKIGKKGRTITVKLRYRDFQTVTRSKTLPFFTDETKMIEKTALSLLRESTEAGDRPVRLIGLAVKNLSDPSVEFEQLRFDLPIW